jgi:hypothetical protein
VPASKVDRRIVVGLDLIRPQRGSQPGHELVVLVELPINRQCHLAQAGGVNGRVAALWADEIGCVAGSFDLLDEVDCFAQPQARWPVHLGIFARAGHGDEDLLHGKLLLGSFLAILPAAI